MIFINNVKFNSIEYNMIMLIQLHQSYYDGDGGE